MRWRLHVGLFVATLLSALLTGALQVVSPEGVETLRGLVWYGLLNLWEGWPFAVPLMAILLTHELGHYVAARIHRVPATLPYFIPLPILSPFGTMGAVISMKGRIRSRNALLDIGAAGPLAGIVVAIPVTLWGLATSPVKEVSGHGLLEGQCLLYSLLKYVALGPIPEGHDVFLNGAAFAGWAGLFVTMLNLLPVSQLDGGHIAYALFDTRQNRYGRWVHYSLLGWFAYNLFAYNAFEPGMIWLVWFGLIALLRRAGGGVDHPPTEPGALSPRRRYVAILCLVLFVVLFMPTPMRQY
jgi:membrane-associated protease RseP (regulator of RpoE activity)